MNLHFVLRQDAAGRAGARHGRADASAGVGAAAAGGMAGAAGGFADARDVTVGGFADARGGAAGAAADGMVSFAPGTPPAAADLAGLPAGLLQALGSAVRSLDMQQVEQLLQQVDTLDAGNGRRLRAMLERHQFQPLWELLTAAASLKGTAA